MGADIMFKPAIVQVLEGAGSCKLGKPRGLQLARSPSPEIMGCSEELFPKVTPNGSFHKLGVL